MSNFAISTQLLLFKTFSVYFLYGSYENNITEEDSNFKLGRACEKQNKVKGRSQNGNNISKPKYTVSFFRRIITGRI